MAMIDTTRPAPFGAITTYRATTTLSNMATAVTSFINARTEARRTAAELARLSPAMLADIGYDESDVIALRARAGLI
ncbi:MAG: DUF1127 domain-containing protein [Pseudomonadota bacterium]